MKRKAIKILKYIMIIIIVIISLLLITTALYMRQEKFGQKPSGARLERIKKSPNFKDGKFQNLSFTPSLAEGHSYFQIAYKQFFKRDPRRIPKVLLPSVKSDLLNLPADSNFLVWFGHSSYFLQIDGKRILVDPVFSGNASPLPGTVRSFNGSDVYAVSDLPEIDYLFISHDHYDHIDYETMTALKTKTKKVICGLGVGAHFERWGYSSGQIFEKDWNDKVDLDIGFTAFVETARHYSGRGFTRNNTLWASYVLQTPTMKIYLGGDSGYDTHYAAIGRKHGSFDLAILDNGQYDSAWRYIHNLPGDVLQAAKDLHAKRLFPVHSSKFALANHAWDEPLRKLSALNENYNLALVTPIIGELVNLRDSSREFKQWWVGLD